MLVPTDKRARAYVELCARQMHPDLYADVPMSEDAAELEKRYNYVDQLDDLRKVYLEMDAISLPWKAGALQSSLTVYDYTLPSPFIDTKKSLAALRKAMIALRRLGATVTKEYTEVAFMLKAEFPSGLIYTVMVDRAAVCKKKVVGKEWVAPSAGYEREIVEWDCTPVSLLKGE